MNLRGNVQEESGKWMKMGALPKKNILDLIEFIFRHFASNHSSCGVEKVSQTQISLDHTGCLSCPHEPHLLLIGFQSEVVPARGTAWIASVPSQNPRTNQGLQ